MNAPRCFRSLVWLTAVTAVVGFAQTPPASGSGKSGAGSEAKDSPTVSVTVTQEPAGAGTSAEEKSAPVAAKTPAPPVNKFRMPPPISRGASAPVQVPPRFLQVRARIDALFALRNNPPPKPDERTNPFRPPGAYVATEPVAAPEGVVVPVSGGRDLALLQQAVATLKIGGTVTFNKVLMITINSGSNRAGTYKAGDVINVNLNSDAVPLRVHEITRYSVTFRLNEAEMTLKTKL